MWVRRMKRRFEFIWWGWRWGLHPPIFGYKIMTKENSAMWYCGCHRAIYFGPLEIRQWRQGIKPW